MEEKARDVTSAKEDKNEEKQSKGETTEERVAGKKKRREKRLKAQPKNVTGNDVPDTAGPRGICISDFVQARATELHNMDTAISQHGGARRTFQTLPRHMRRRSMSHNIKRLPHRLREQARNEVVECTAKKPSRKTRRRSGKLAEEYGRRSERCRWLETHIWHAKRFKMIEYHGYKIAGRCCDKGARATYRYLHTGCLLYDSSYHGCLELSGSQGDIIAILKPLMSKQAGVTLEAADYISGCRSGDMMLYQSHCYPNNAIGPAQLLWRPDQITSSRQLWLLIHPAIVDKLLKEFTENVKSLATAGSVIITNLRDELVHYKLIGACCNDVIIQTIQPVWKPGDDKGPASCTMSDDELVDKKKFFSFFSQAKSPAELPNKTIVGLTVRDFRLSSLPKNIASSPQSTPTNTGNILEIVTPKLSQCYIWSKTVRDSVQQAMVPQCQIDKIRSDKLRDTSEELKDLECQLPILLLHQTVNGTGVGWDILLPAKWGMSLWLSLVYNGARVIGFEEMKVYHLEQSILHFPTDYPDTDAGRQLELNNSKTLQSKYCKYPPDKRPNFGKLNSPSPFLPAWSDCCYELVEQQAVDTAPVAKRAKLLPEKPSVLDREITYYVLRSVKLLVSLSNLLDSLKAVKTSITTEEGWLSILNDMKLSTVAVDHYNSLVAISFVMYHRGNPMARSMLCIPLIEDLLKLSQNDSCHGYYGPMELLNKKGVSIQQNNRLVTGTTSLTNKELKSARRDLKVSKSQNTEDFSCHGNQSNDINTTLKLQPIKSSRAIIGYVTNAGYVFSQGTGAGVGLCSLLGLLDLLKLCYLQNHPVTLLVREHDSLQYRFAFINILLNQF